MSVSGINNDAKTYQATNAATTTAKKAADSEQAATASAEVKETDAAVYEKGSAAEMARSGKTDTNMVAKMKAEAEQRTAQLRSLVEKMMLKQGQSITSATDYLMALKNGTLEVDEATAKQAQEDIGEDGYWGVEQTSERLVSFAKALAGDDPAKADMMLEAIEKGFKEATKTWGDDLPELCQKTLEATREKMAAWKNGGVTAETAAATETAAAAQTAATQG